MMITFFNDFFQTEFKVFHNDGIPFLIQPKIFKDSRGLFLEEFKANDSSEVFKDLSWCKQINMSTSIKNVFRGFHMQKTDEYSQGKLIECLNGSIYDFAIDVRQKSKTYGKILCVKLDDINHNQFWIPRGFLHGFVAISDKPNTIMYKCDNIYHKQAEISVKPSSVLTSDKVSYSENIQEDTMQFLENLIKNLDKCIFSEKDLAGLEFNNHVIYG